MTQRLTNALATTGAMAAVFADDAMIDGMLQFEIALAAAQADCGVIPLAAASAIARAAGPASAYDSGKIALAASGSATLAIPFV